VAKVKGVVHFDYTECKGCELCVAECPTDVLAISSQRNKKGYLVPEAKPDLCNGCMRCELICPEFVIDVEVVRS
jgi:2-oxoglutarate ferredoxin oxidoreductase subunit delta